MANDSVPTATDVGANPTPNVNQDTNGSADDEYPAFDLGDFPIDDYRPFKVIVIGAGASGIHAGIRFRQHIPNLTMVIYDKLHDIGGTWCVNRYPGISNDGPSFCYQYSYDRKTDWSRFYSPGAEVQSYLKDVVERYRLGPYIKLRHEMTSARYDEPTGKWHIRLTRPSDTGDLDEFEDTADLLFLGIGTLSRWSWPDIDGLEEFKGPRVHSANWNFGGSTWEEDVQDWKDKNIAVIGLGSSALQIVSALQDKVGRLYNFARGRTWIIPPFITDIFSDLLSRDATTDENYTFTDEEKKALKDPELGERFRRSLEEAMNTSHAITLRDTPLQRGSREQFREHMLRKLKDKPEVAEKLIPDFSVTTRRLTPAPGYLEALCKDHVEFINSPIKRITPTGIETIEGQHTNVDIIICATGYDTSYSLPFPIIGRNGADIRDKWSPHPKTYLSVCVDEFPNMFLSCGPNSLYAAGSVIIMIEHQVDYAVMVAKKMQRERLKSVEVKREAVDDFEEYIEHYFPKTVFTEKVRSWYKGGKEEGRVVALWPGSTLHGLKALRNPRWEDFNYENRDKTRNRLRWLGDGQTMNEKTGTGNRSWYIEHGYMDIPPLPVDEDNEAV